MYGTEIAQIRSDNYDVHIFNFLPLSLDEIKKTNLI